MDANMLIKPVVSGVVASVLDMKLLGETNSRKSMAFGAAVALGVGVGERLSVFAPQFELGFISNGKAVESRVMEWVLASGGAYAVNKYAFSNDPIDMRNAAFWKSVGKKVGVIVLSDIAGEYASDFFNSRPLAIFQ